MTTELDAEMLATRQQHLTERAAVGAPASGETQPRLDQVVELPLMLDILAMAAAGALGAGVAILLAGGSLLLLVPAAVGGGLIGAAFRGMAARRT